MQGLAGYNDDSPPSSPIPGGSQPRKIGQSHNLNKNSQAVPSISATTIVRSSKSEGKSRAVMREDEGEQSRSSRTSSPRTRNAITEASSAGPSRPRSPTPTSIDLNEAAPVAIDPFEGMTEEEIFKIVTRPAEIDGVADWGIPAAVNSDLASDALNAKVQQFLRLKYERGQHINTTLLSSSSFANPHIYSKLVEFVDIDERATAFPSGGWVTRRSIEDLIPEYGPQSLSATQKAKQEAIKRSQEVGKRSNIQFAPGRRREEERGGAKKRSREDEARDRDRDRDRYRPKDRRHDDRRERDGRERR